MLVLRESTISTFDIVKVKIHMAYDQGDRIANSNGHVSLCFEVL